MSSHVKHWRRAVFLIAAVALLTITIRGYVGGQQKPIREDPVFTEFREPPETLGAMLSDTDAVVRGRLLGGRPLAKGSGEAFTANRFQTIEVLHRTPVHAVESPVEVLRPIGEFDKGSYIQRSYQADFPELARGQEYLLFLSWNEALEGWVFSFGPDSVFELKAAGPSTFGKSETAKELARKTTQTLVDEVRRLGRR